MGQAHHFIEGLLMGAGLIIAIGAQNAYVLKKGIEGKHRNTIAFICSLSDALLITAGICGMGIIFTAHPKVTGIIAAAGSLYLLWFSFTSFRSAFKEETMGEESGPKGSQSTRTVITTVLALTFLNPHVYLDTVVMLGGFGAARPEEARPLFGAGAAAASFIWFYALAYGASYLRPVFTKPRAWKILDTAIGLVMAYIAVKLFLFGTEFF